MNEPRQEPENHHSDSEASSFLDRPIQRSRLEGADLSELLQSVLRMISHRREVSLTELARNLNQEVASLQPLLQTLIDQGFIQTVMISGEQRYQTRHTARRGRKVPDQIWRNLAE
jgi:DNA-binding MarR family transcriptional regulator